MCALGQGAPMGAPLICCGAHWPRCCDKWSEAACTSRGVNADFHKMVCNHSAALQEAAASTGMRCCTKTVLNQNKIGMLPNAHKPQCCQNAPFSARAPQAAHQYRDT